MKNYLVTGGSKGIGKALVDLLLQDKNNTVFNIDIVDSQVNEKLKFIKAGLANKQDISNAVSMLKNIACVLQIAAGWKHT